MCLFQLSIGWVYFQLYIHDLLFCWVLANGCLGIPVKLPVLLGFGLGLFFHGLEVIGRGAHSNCLLGSLDSLSGRFRDLVDHGNLGFLLGAKETTDSEHEKEGNGSKDSVQNSPTGWSLGKRTRSGSSNIKGAVSEDGRAVVLTHVGRELSSSIESRVSPVLQLVFKWRQIETLLETVSSTSWARTSVNSSQRITAKGDLLKLVDVVAVDCGSVLCEFQAKVNIGIRVFTHTVLINHSIIIQVSFNRSVLSQKTGAIFVTHFGQCQRHCLFRAFVSIDFHIHGASTLKEKEE
mmetsp:Transcript_33774/g.81883  ORF Transcript_33774/g.81883 Transcript_33774/m.81883 type:complete len:292 (-) Transcript_33774:28-903(-)